MIRVDGKVFVSTKDFQYENIKACKIVEKKDELFVLSQQYDGNSYSFVGIENVQSVTYEGTTVTCKFINTQGIEYQLEVPIECSFMTYRGPISVKRINDMDVFIDSKALPCKLISKIFNNDQVCEMVNITPMYNRNLFYNDILIKCGR